MATELETLQKRIETLENAGLDASDERTKLDELLAQEGSGAPETQVITKADVKVMNAATLVKGAKKAVVAEAEVVGFEMEVDVDSFESGGSIFDAPETPGVYTGFFKDVVIPTTYPDRRWFVFMTDDERVVAEKGHNVPSVLSVVPNGAFILKTMLDGLGLPYEGPDENGMVRGSIPKGLPCMLEYEESTYKGKTSIQLVKVYAEGSVESAI